MQTCQRDLLQTNMGQEGGCGDEEKNLGTEVYGGRVITTGHNEKIEIEAARKIEDNEEERMTPRPKNPRGDETKVQKPTSSFS